MTADPLREALHEAMDDLAIYDNHEREEMCAALADHPAVREALATPAQPALDVEGVIAEMLAAESAAQSGVDRLHKATNTLASLARQQARLQGQSET